MFIYVTTQTNENENFSFSLELPSTCYSVVALATFHAKGSSEAAMCLNDFNKETNAWAFGPGPRHGADVSPGEELGLEW